MRYMQKTEEFTDLYIENDKWNAPFLLAASFQNLIDFLGSYSHEGVLYWQFSPKNKAQQLVDQFRTKTSPPIPAKDLFEAIDVFWKQISKERNEGMKYGEKSTL